MRLVTTKSLKENDTLCRPVYHENGNVLIQADIPLSQRIINRLIKLGIGYVYINDEITSDIVVKNVVSEETRLEAIQTIKKEFAEISNHYVINKSINTIHLSKTFTKLVHKILADIKTADDVISILSDVFCYDSYIFTHSLNVTIYTIGLAKEMKFTEKQLFEIGLGAILHDVGKIMVPKDILEKNSRLTAEEFAIIKQHSRAGFDLLRNTPNISLITAHCAFQHHERLNGSGYPQGISGDQIHRYAKILAVADVFDACTSNRIYRKAMLPHEALEILYAGAGTLFDKEIVEMFSRTVAIYPTGLTVYLNDGRKGVVSKQNKFFSMRPIIRVFEHAGLRVEPYEIDLLKDRHIAIIECEARLGVEQ
ncbi:HD-GYP domain-containing protein [Anaerobacillus alkaliphilus]|uniref:HD-GYP domain-containing protein n=1 Tax=Anaerobacillus alkaliphilus TaxID=1548597 RepID=A0A4Q0VV02_9BACI|nr:HD-GYP domain-containing protein [Anaerobacillus alkaliphilus]RXJ01805.1 HD-GYP domain-containing protein [Anaerobacillus alkaliphilus]